MAGEPPLKGERPMARATTRRQPLLVALLAGIMLAVADLLTVTLSMLLLIFAGVLFGIFLNGVSRWVADHTPLSYRWSFAVVVTGFLLTFVAGLYYLGSQAAEQATALSSQVQSATQTLTERLDQNEWAQKYLPDLSEMQGGVSAGSLLPKVIRGMSWLGWAFTGIFVIFFVGLYNAFDPHLYRTGLVKLVPPDRRDRASQVLRRLHSALGHWILGRLISMAIIGVFTAIGLALLGVPLPVALGVLAALLTFIPNIGPILAAVPQALLALEVGTTTVLYVILLNVALQAVESYVVTPVVQRYEASLPPALTISVQLLLGVLVGVVGLMMAAPLTAAVMVLVQMLYIQDRLGDPDPSQLANRS